MLDNSSTTPSPHYQKVSSTSPNPVVIYGRIVVYVIPYVVIQYVCTHVEVFERLYRDRFILTRTTNYDPVSNNGRTIRIRWPSAFVCTHNRYWYERIEIVRRNSRDVTGRATMTRGDPPPPSRNIWPIRTIFRAANLANRTLGRVPFNVTDERGRRIVGA